MDERRRWFITFTTYGTHLPGDERGSVRRGRKGRPSYELPSSPSQVEGARRLLAQHPFTLDEQQRSSVAAAITEVCAFKTWTLHAINVRTNHVHLLVGAPGSPDVVMNTCKAWATRRLREEGLLESERRIWTRHGSTRSVNSQAAFERVASYIIEGQGPDIGGLGTGPLD